MPKPKFPVPRFFPMGSVLLAFASTCVAFALLFPGASSAAERVLDTGAIRVALGRTSAGFIDEVHLDRNGDGVYSPDELIVKQPDNEPALVVSYIVETASNGVATGKLIQGKASIDSVELVGLKAVIKGMLHFEGYESTPTEIAIEGRKNSAVLNVDFSFTPLRNARGLLLKEASLRLYGVFEPGEPGKTRRSMSTGDFRNTPRPESSYQPLVWQLGGSLVESPWHWRSWLAWSENTGPVTVREGAAPPKELAFFMRDDHHGIQALIAEPAGAAPVELSGVGLPSNLGIFAWSPRIPPLAMHRDLPTRFGIKGIGLHFFATEVKGLAGKGDQYWKRVNEIVTASRQELARERKPAQPTPGDPRLPEELLRKRQRELAAMPSRGWEANVQNTPLPEPLSAPTENPGSGQDWVAIEIDSAASTTIPLPASGGIPFPRSVLKSTEQVRLVDADNRELPIQADKLATWPDGSVKWVLISVLSGEPKAARPPLRLEYGPQVVRKASPAGKLTITRTADGLNVDTGALRFNLSKTMSGLFGDLWLKPPGSGGAEEHLIRAAAETERANRMDLLALGSAGYSPNAFHAEGGQAEPSRAEIEEIRVEREGPLSAHLLVKGRYRYAKLGRGRGETYRNDGCEFWIRYTVHAGQPYVEIKHSFVFEGNPDLEMIQDLSLSTPVKFGDKPLITVAADGQPMAAFRAGKAGIFQDNPYAAEVWSEDGTGREQRVHAVANAADGWMDVGDGTRGVTFGVRNMREMFAKELSANADRLTVSLWPKRARLLDTRRYSRQYGDGESTSFGQGAAQGVSRSHDLFFYFHAGDAAAAESAGVARSLLRPAFLKAPPAWYADSGAAGAFRPREARQHASWEALIADGLDYFLYHRQLWSWFGIYDYGDMQQVPTRNGGWERLAGRWGWGNNEALIDMLFYEQFMRTGQREYLDTALAMTRHTQEVDLINSHDYKGNRQVKMHGHRHNVDHWGDGYVGIRVAAPHGFRLGYFLTGDLRIFDQLRMGMDAHWDSAHNYDKEQAAGLGYLTFFWEATGEKVYQEALNAYLDFQTGHFKKFGNIYNDVWKFRKDINRPLPATPLSGAPTNFFFQNFGTAYSLMELADLTGRSDLVEALVQFARTTMLERGASWEALFCHYRLMAFAYRHTGDPVFLRYATERAAKLGVVSNRKTWSQSSAIERFDNKLSMLAWAGQGLPYVMRAMDERAKDPLVTFDIPWTLPIPKGRDSAALKVAGGQSRARAGALTGYEWQVDGKASSTKMDHTLDLPPGKHRISLRTTDNEGRSAVASQTVTVWDPGVVAQLCFRGRIEGFVGGEYSDAKGFGFTRGTRLTETAEPRRQGKKGCPEVHIAGAVKVKTGPGRFTVEMGGTDFWTETMGNIRLQGNPLDVTIAKESTKKLSWSHTGDVTVGADGMLTIDFVPGPKREPVVLAYVIVREKH